MALSSNSPERSSGNTSSSSNISYLSYPVKYAVTSALRRLSSDPASTFGLSSQKFSRKTNSRKTSPERSSSAHPDPIDTTPRSTQPFQPPPLSPLSLTGFNSEQVLTSQLAEEIRLLVPARLQLCEEWKLAFSLERDGSSLSTLFDKAEEHRGRRVGYVLVVKDGSPNGGAFGAYLSDPPRPSNGHYYGTGECFLWRASVLSSQVPVSALSLPPRPSEDTTHYESRDVTIGSPTRLRRSSHAFSPTSPTHPSKPTSSKTQQNPKKKKSDDLISFDSDNEDKNEDNVQNGDSIDDDFGTFHSGNTPAAESAPHFDFPSTSNTSRNTNNNNNTAKNNHNHKQNKQSRHIIPASVSPTASGTQTPHRIRFKAFPYSGLNDYMIFCEHSFLSVGGGDGHYGLFLDGSLEKGLTAKCPTFGNEVLSDEGGKFEVLGVELWAIGV